MCDASGRLYNGDELLYLMVRDRMATGPVAGAVGTLMTNMALEVAFKEMGVGFARAKVGDRYVLEVMQENGWLFGGEGSGHLLAWTSTPPATASSPRCRCCRRSSARQPSLESAASELVLFPQTLINVRVRRASTGPRTRPWWPRKEAVERELGDSGRVLIRASGTEPLMRVMVEANAKDGRIDGAAHRRQAFRQFAEKLRPLRRMAGVH
jgi:phosphoglucosamine mutase